MRVRIEQSLLGTLYMLVIAGRNAWWRVRRPLLIGVRVLVVEGDRVLLVRHRSGRTPWSLPGGGVEKHEPLAAAAQRECFEEAGVRVRIDSAHGIYDHFFLGMSNYIAVFVAVPLSPLALRRSLEIAEARYFPLDALPPTIERGSARRISEYCSGGGQHHGVWYAEPQGAAHGSL